MGKRMLDLAAAGVCGAIFAIAWVYADKITYSTAILWISGSFAAGFVVLAACERRNGEGDKEQTPEKLPTRQDLITKSCC